MMDDLISRRDAINAVSEITTTMSVCTNKDECYGMKRMQAQALSEIENLPSIEIVYCENCRRYIRHDKRCGYWNHGVKHTMWCSQAERREDGRPD